MIALLQSLQSRMRRRLAARALLLGLATSLGWSAAQAQAPAGYPARTLTLV